MTIKKISVEKRVQTPLQKKKVLSQTVFFNTESQSDQYYRNGEFAAIENSNCRHSKRYSTKQIPTIIANCIGLPRPFY